MNLNGSYFTSDPFSPLNPLYEILKVRSLNN